MKRFSVSMHHNTIDELTSQGKGEEAIKDFDFDTIPQAFNFEYPFHRDNYVITEWDLDTIFHDGEGGYDCEALTSISMCELNGKEEDLTELIDY